MKRCQVVAVPFVDTQFPDKTAHRPASIPPDETPVTRYCPRMFGIIRPCRNRLGDDLRASWTAHLCGMCLALRDAHGHLARLVTNYDAVVVSALVEAQAGAAGRRRAAGPCALRGMRGASVATAGGAELAASVSLLLASAKIDDHVADGDLDGALRVRAARAVAGRFAAAGRTSSAGVALDGTLLLDAVSAQRAAETDPTSILDVTAPTEAATALAFGHTAVVAGRPENVEALTEVGRLFGRLAHLLDAVEDLHADAHAGHWNPITALGLPPTDVRALCDDARLGIRLALRDAAFDDDRLVHVLLVHEVETAVDRTFATAGQPPPIPPPSTPPPLTPPLPPDQQPPDQTPPTGWEPPEAPRQRNLLTGCLGWLVLCGTCQVCCAGEYVNPCSGRQRTGACRKGGDCREGCDGCSDCGDCCECGCDCCSCCDC